MPPYPRPGQPAELVIGERITCADVPALCARLGPAPGAVWVTCDVGALRAADAAALDGLARLQLAMRRRGRRIRLLHASGELSALVALSGLDDVLPVCDLPVGRDRR